MFRRQNLALRMLLAVFLCCLTAPLFAQSLATPSSTSEAVADTPAVDAAEAGERLPQRTRIDWAEFHTFDKGYESSVAIHRSGLIIEVHSSGASRFTYTGLYYRIGKLDAAAGTVAWGPSRQWVTGGVAGSWPAVAISPEGYVILTYSNAFQKSDGILRYYAGTLNLQGGTDQHLSFKVSNAQYDTGFHNSISLNYNGVLAEAHESNGGKGIFYRIGHLAAPGSGDFRILWDTGSGGQWYDNGINPHISLNDNNQVVEVHQVASNDYKLHYMRGSLSGSKITFSEDHPRYSDYGMRPCVSLLNNGYVIEMHGANYDSRNYVWEYFNRVGTLDSQQPRLINWLSNTRLGYIESPGGIGTDGTYLVATTERSGHLYYSWAIAP